jgi:hypothetical protein
MSYWRRGDSGLLAGKITRDGFGEKRRGLYCDTIAQRGVGVRLEMIFLGYFGLIWFDLV